MATNKNATIRYQALDRCFRNPGRRYYIDDLIEACNEALLDYDPKSTGIQRRQVYNDILFMKDSLGFSAPIETFQDGKKVYYRYEDLSYSINNQPLNEQEARTLKEALITLSRFKGLPQFEWMEEMQFRLENYFKLKSDKKVIEFEENPFLKGRDYLAIIYDSVVNMISLSVQYKPFSGDSRTIVVSPYYLKEYNNRWFLLAGTNETGFLVTLALDRIEGISNSKEPYLINENVNFEEYFEDVIGITIPAENKVERVIVEIDNDLWPYIQTKPLHGSQKVIVRGENSVTVELMLILNYELEALLLSYGEKIKVVGPTELLDKLKNRVLELFKRYY